MWKLITYERNMEDKQKRGEKINYQKRKLIKRYYLQKMRNKRKLAIINK